MTRTWYVAGLLAGLAAVVTAQQRPPQAPPPPPAVKVGEPMPDFTLSYLETTAEGRPQARQVTLGEFRGRQPVVLAFFPAAFSPG